MSENVASGWPRLACREPRSSDHFLPAGKMQGGGSQCRQHRRDVVARGMHKGAFFFSDDVTRGCARGVTCAQQEGGCLNQVQRRRRRWRSWWGGYWLASRRAWITRVNRVHTSVKSRILKPDSENLSACCLSSSRLFSVLWIHGYWNIAYGANNPVGQLTKTSSCESGQVYFMFMFFMFLNAYDYYKAMFRVVTLPWNQTSKCNTNFGAIMVLNMSKNGPGDISWYGGEE